MVGCDVVEPLVGVAVGEGASEVVPGCATGTGSASVGPAPGVRVDCCGEKPAATYSSVFQPAKLDTTPTPMTRPPANDAANLRRRRRSRSVWFRGPVIVTPSQDPVAKPTQSPTVVVLPSRVKVRR